LIRRIYNPAAIAAVCLPVLLTVSMNGCGGCGSSNSNHGNLSKEEIEARRKAWQADYDMEHPPSTSKSKAAAPKGSGPPPSPRSAPAAVSPKPRQDGEESPSNPKSPKKSIRPKDFADWKPEDFDSAQRDGDPRLEAAVTQLGERSTDKENAAELLIKLLESSRNGLPARNSEVEDGSRPTSKNNPKLTQAIVAALIANGTPIARQTLAKIADGSLCTDGGLSAATAALKAVAVFSCRESEDLLFRIVTAPKLDSATVRPEIDPEKLRATALFLAESSASEAFRVRLAEYAAKPDALQPIRDQLWSCLSKPSMENLSAQKIWYQNGQSDEKTRQFLEQNFAALSEAMLGRLLGVPSVQAKTQAEIGLASTDLRRAAEILWDPRFLSAVQNELKKVEGLKRETRLLRLAGTVPCQPMRVTLLKTLEKYWEEGPGALEPLVKADGGPQEPGFLLVVKMLPRKDDSPHVASAPNQRGNGGGSRPSSLKLEKIAAEREAKQKQEQEGQRRRENVSRQWMAFSENLVRAICRRFYVAALAPHRDGSTSDSLDAPEDLPLKPHPNARITASCGLNWPEELEGRLSGLSITPLRVRYVRIEQSARPAKLLAYYRRKLPACDEHANQNGVWFDSFSTDKQRGDIQSIDVLISKPNKDVPIILGEEQPMIVEILSIEAAGDKRGQSPFVRSTLRAVPANGDCPLFFSGKTRDD
jgi:hypothetical protein